MISYCAKLVALFRLYLSDVFAYKAVGVIWVISDLHMALLMPLVWRAVGGVGGMSPQDVTTYYIVVLTVSQFVTCHLLWDIAWDIREGTFSSLLLRPISHLASSFARNLAWRLGKLVLFAPVLGVMLLAYGLPDVGHLRFSMEFWISLVIGQVMAFLAAYSVAMIALWTTEITSIFQVYYFPEMLFSGRVVPLSALPQWAQNLAEMTHFRYTVGFPSDVLMNKITGPQAWQGIGVQLCWTLVFWLTSRVLFQAGVKRYYGFGL